MSGICGILEFGERSVSPQALSAMNKALSARGPDGETVFLEGNIGFAHTLLRVSRSDHGIVSEGSKIHVAVDGTLHNISGLQREFGNCEGCSTAQTLIQAYLFYGLDFVRQLEGAFAFVLFDKDKGRLILARDKLGIKSLYVSFDKDRLLFGSEIKALLNSGYVTPTLNYQALADYLSFQFLLGGKTFFHGIQSLAPATLWVWENKKSNKRRYWHFSFQTVQRPEAEYIRQTRHVFHDAIKALDGDTVKASHLSGGLDSSIISLLLAQENRTLKTFSAVYPYGEKFDESRYALSLSRKIKSWHTFIYPTAKDVIACLPNMLADLQEPVSDVAFSRYFVAQKIKDTYKDTQVVYCGQGADELFGGYAFYLDYLKGRFKGPLYLQSYQRRRLFSQGQLKQLLTEKFYERLFGHYDVLEAYRQAFESPGEVLHVAAHADIELFLPYWLQVEGRINSAFAMEVCYPFLYHKVVDLASRMPPEMKIRGNETKYILKEAFRDSLPADVLSHEKIGLRTPSSRWFREELYDFAADVLLTDNTRSRGFFNLAYIERILDENKTGKSNHGWQIWTLVLFELWHRMCVDIEMDIE